MRQAIPTAIALRISRAKRAGWAALMGWAQLVCVCAIHAQSGFVDSATITNYSGILVTTNGALSPIPVRASATFRNNTNSGLSVTYRAGFRLLDSNGNSVTGPRVFSATFVLFLPAHLQDTGSAGVTLVPAVPVPDDPHATYTLEVQFSRQTTLGNFVTATPVSTQPFRFAVVDSATPTTVAGLVENAGLTRGFAVATIVGGQSFQVSVQGVFGRRDQTGSPVSSDNYVVNFDAQVFSESILNEILLVNARTTITVSVPNHDALGGPAAIALSKTLDLQPAAQLDSTDHYKVIVKLSYAGPDAVEVPADVNTQTAQRLLHFNGTLLFGPVSATITALNSDPQPLGTVPNVGENTNVGLAPGGAVLPNLQNYTASTAGDLSALLHINGTAEVTAGSALVAAPTATDFGSIHGVSFTRNNVTLDATGAHAGFLTVNFPAGMGVIYGGVANSGLTRRFLGSYPALNVPLDGFLQPTVGPVSLLPSSVDATQISVTHDDLPVVFQTSVILWDASAGTFRAPRNASAYVRRDELNLLDNARGSLTDPTAANRPSNEGYFRALNAAAGQDIVITADPQGRGVLTTARVELLQSTFTAHFPLGTVIGWQSGAVVVQDGLLDTTQSLLGNVDDVIFHNWAGAPENPPVPVPPAFAGPDDSFRFTPNARTWTFTRDGGLHAEGIIADAPLRWGARIDGTFADVTGNFTVAAAHLPGNVLRASLATTVDDNRAGELLLSGHGQPGDPTYVERPGNPSYSVGAADYAGLNFRVGTDGAQTATSEIGDASVGPYALRGTTKYYTRPAGVSGIHEAVTSSFAGSALVVHGFPLSLTNFQLSFLDNGVRQSLISGTVNVPGARGLTGFAQPFENLLLTDKGELGPITIPSPNNFLHTLTYWRAQFHPLLGEFQQSAKSSSTWALVFGAEVLLPGVVKDPIRGGLGFLATGNLVAASLGFPGVNSRLKPPKTIGLHGSGSLLDASRPAFSVHPVSDLYFNDASALDAPNLGFVTFAGTVHVPFFQDLKVQVLARATGGDTNVRSGWGVPGNDFFTNAKFDASNHGFPPGVQLSDYEDTIAGAAYNPHAKQNWLGFVDFDLPVMWDAALRRFVSSAPEERNFLVFNSQRVISQLSPSGADLRFGLQFQGLPRANLSSLIVDDGELTNQVIGLIPRGPDLVAALKAFDMLLDGQSDKLISDGVETAVGGFVDNVLLPDLLADLNFGSAAAAVARINTNALTLTSQLQANLQAIVGTATQVNTVIKTISDALQKIDVGLSAADALLAKDASGKRGAFLFSTLNLCTQLGGLDSGEATAITAQLDNLINVQLASTLDEIQRAINQVHGLVTDARSAINTVQGILQASINTANALGTTLPQAVLGSMQNYFAKANDPTGSYAADFYASAKLRADLKRAASDVIIQSTFVTDLQMTMRELVEPLHDQYSEAFNQVYGVLNDVVRSALSELTNKVLGAVNENLANVNKAIGGFMNTFRMTRLSGTARIVGSVLDRAHIDGMFTLDIAGPLTLRGALDFQRYQGNQPVPNCAIGGAPNGVITITTTLDGSCSIASCPPAHAHAIGQYTMGSDGSPLAVSGSLSLDADLHLDVISLKHAEFDFAFGVQDNYLYGQGAGSIYLFDVDVNAFIGRTNDPAVLKMVDPLIDPLLTGLGFSTALNGFGRYVKAVTGIYFHANGAVSLNRIFEIPDDVVKLQARGGQGNFVFLQQGVGVTPGLRWDFGIGISIAGVGVDADLHALGGLGPIPLVDSPEGFADLAKSVFTSPGFPGAITGKFKAKAAFLSQTFDFTATGTYIPPPLVPPPGGFLVKKLKF